MTSTPAEPARTTDPEDFRRRLHDLLSRHDEQTLAAWAASGHVPRDAVVALARNGVFRERWEPGAERGVAHLLMLSVETAQRSSGLAVAAMGHSEMFIGGLTWLGDRPLHRSLLDDALAGRAVGCFSATEPQGGSNLTDIATTVVRSGAGWRMRGRKRYVSNVGEASHALVLARMDDARSSQDLSLFLVPLVTRGVTIEGFFDTLDAAGCDVGELSIDADLPADALLGKAGLGMAYVSYLLTFERISICAQLLASAETALRLAASYARQRIGAGARVMDRQAVRHRLACSQAELWNLQSRLRELTVSAVQREHLPARETAALKLVAGRTASDIIDTAMQVLGARGVSRTFPLERLWREARLARLGGGTDEVLADLVAAGIDRPDLESARSLAGYLAADKALPRRGDP